jgi:hypothetical protein
MPVFDFRDLTRGAPPQDDSGNNRVGVGHKPSASRAPGCMSSARSLEEKGW